MRGRGTVVFRLRQTPKHKLCKVCLPSTLYTGKGIVQKGIVQKSQVGTTWSILTKLGKITVDDKVAYLSGVKQLGE